MQTALLDTNVVAAWHGGDRAIKDAAVKHLSALGKAPGLFISAVTVQEVMVWAHVHGEQEAMKAFLQENFTILEFTEDCALRAASLAATLGRPTRKKPRGADRQQIDIWQRDAAIAGTAAVRKLNAVWTRDAGFRQFQEHVDFDIVVLPGATKSTE